jgi:tripartite-type tricarboxylate transporter receptor subunit TctC
MMKRTLALCLTALVLGFPAVTVHAEAWPSQTMKVIVPITPGSVIDVAPRLVFEQLAKQVGQPVVVENRPGAGQTMGASAVARSEPDGYTLLVNSAAHAIAPSLLPKPTTTRHATLRHHPAGLLRSCWWLRRARIPTAADLTAAAKAKPGVQLSSPGVGSASHSARSASG